MARTSRQRSIRYKPDIRGTYESVINTSTMRAYLHGVAEEGVGVAQGLSADFRQSGEYMESFAVENGSYAGRTGDERPEARIANTAPYARAVEKRHHVLAKTANAIEAKYGRRGGK